MPKPEQVSGAEVRNMPPEEISRALRDGELEDYLAGRDPGVPEPIARASDTSVTDPPANAADQGAMGEQAETGQITDRGQLAKMSAEQIVAARRSGRLNHLLGIRG